MATVEEYKLREAEFMARTDALCENKGPAKCDCCKCPCNELCAWLHKESPYKVVFAYG